MVAAISRLPLYYTETASKTITVGTSTIGVYLPQLRRRELQHPGAPTQYGQADGADGYNNRLTAQYQHIRQQHFRPIIHYGANRPLPNSEYLFRVFKWQTNIQSRQRRSPKLFWSESNYRGTHITKPHPIHSVRRHCRFIDYLASTTTALNIYRLVDVSGCYLHSHTVDC